MSDQSITPFNAADQPMSTKIPDAPQPTHLQLLRQVDARVIDKHVLPSHSGVPAHGKRDGAVRLRGQRGVDEGDWTQEGAEGGAAGKCRQRHTGRTPPTHPPTHTRVVHSPRQSSEPAAELRAVKQEPATATQHSTALKASSAPHRGGSSRGGAAPAPGRGREEPEGAAPAAAAASSAPPPPPPPPPTHPGPSHQNLLPSWDMKRKGYCSRI